MLPVQRIVWPTDFSAASLDALGPAAELARTFDAELICLHVMEPPPENTEWADASHLSVPLPLQEERDRLQGELQRLVADRLRQGPQPRVLVELGDAPETILKAAEREKADLIITATHGRTGWRRLVFGSVAERVIREAHCPVLTIRPSAASKEHEGETT